MPEKETNSLVCTKQFSLLQNEVNHQNQHYASLVNAHLRLPQKLTVLQRLKVISGKKPQDKKGMHSTNCNEMQYNLLIIYTIDH